MITKFMGTRSRVKSLDVPYLCQSCKTEHMLVLEVSKGVQLQLTPPCPKCGVAMQLDDAVETYTEVLRLV
jgi:DNA polymerase III alpha subunit (gram-positive type)